MQAAAGDKREFRAVRLALPRFGRPLEVIDSPVDTMPDRLGEMDHPRLLCATEQVAPSTLPARFRASGSKGERWK